MIRQKMYVLHSSHVCQFPSESLSENFQLTCLIPCLNASLVCTPHSTPVYASTALEMRAVECVLAHEVTTLIWQLIDSLILFTLFHLNDANAAETQRENCCQVASDSVEIERNVKRGCHHSLPPSLTFSITRYLSLVLRTLRATGLTKLPDRI